MFEFTVGSQCFFLGGGGGGGLVIFLPYYLYHLTIFLI